MKKKIIISEIIIIIALVLAIILSQITGETEVTIDLGEWTSIYDLEGKSIGMLKDSGYEEEAAKRWDDIDIVYADEIGALTDLLQNHSIDAVLLSCEEASTMVAENAEFSIMLDEMSNYFIIREGEEINIPAIVVRTEDYAYRTAHMDLSGLYEPGYRIAGITGSELIEFPAALFPESISVNFSNFADEFAAVEAGKADAAAAYVSSAEDLFETYDDLAYIGTPITSFATGFGMPKSEKGDKIKSEFNEYLSENYLSGKYEEIFEKWHSLDENETPEINRKTTGENGILRVCTTGTWYPMSYYSGEELTGEFIEIVYDFCIREGYTPVFEAVAYPAEITGINSGAYDFMADSVYITEERAQKINITDPVFYSCMYLVVKEAPQTETVSKATLFIENIKQSFTNDFLKDNRYQMVIAGLATTLVIALFSWLFGTLLGAFVCFLRMRKNPFLSALARIYIKAVQGIPILVLLMVLYYVVFGSGGVDAVIVCVIGFSVDFAAYSSEIFRNGIEAVPEGQSRAAKALGFSETEGFFRVILPQAMNHILPVYSGQLVAMVKLTSVAGYISVMELTKVADIIRSRTYDAFFPLLVSAIIYFLLSWLLVGALKIPEALLSKKPGRVKLRGVNMERITSDEPKFPKGAGRAPGSELLKIEHLKKSFGNITPLKDINCTVNRGDVISVIGPSGTGKSTLLYLINRLEDATEGRVVMDGADTGAKGYDLRKMRQSVGMVFQSFNLFSHLTIVENVMLAQVHLLKRTRQEAYEKSMTLLNSVGLLGKALSFPSELSGGQQQRAAIVRTLAVDPEIILFDEPTSALDPTMVGEVLSVIKNLSAKGMTMMIVTHEMKFARDVSNRVFYMDEGIIYEEGTSEEIFDNPKKPKTRQFIRHLRVYLDHVTQEDEDFFTMKTRIEEFAHRNMLGKAILDGMLAVSEELCHNIIAKGLKGYETMDISFECAEDDMSFAFKVEYKGVAADPFKDADEISLNILKHIAPDISYVDSGDGGLVTGTVFITNTSK